MTLVVLDASAVLAYLHGEPGWTTVENALITQACAVTAANQAEIVARSLDRGVAADAVMTILAELGYAVIDITAVDGQEAGMLRPATRLHGLSLGDRLCLSVARRVNAAVLTADRPWLDLAEVLGLDIQCIRPDSP